MPSSFTFLRNSQSSSSSSSSSENDSKSDQSDDDIDYYRTIRTKRSDNDADMLERPSDHDDSDSQSEESEPDEKEENDLLPSPHYSNPYTLSRQLTLYDNDWPRKKSSMDENQFHQSIHRDQSIFAQFDSNEPPVRNFSASRLFSPERSKSGTLVHHKYQSSNILTTLPSDSAASEQPQLQTLSLLEQMQTLASPSPRKLEIHPSPRDTSIRSDDSRRPLSKIPIRTNSSSQSRSRSPAVKPTSNRRIPSPTTTSSKIPVPVSSSSKGAFRFFTADDRPTVPAQSAPVSESTQATNLSTKQLSPFTPITHSKPLSSTKKSSSSAGNTPSAKVRRAQLPSSDEESDNENLKEDELKLKLKAQKRHGRQTGDLLNKLHENYEELLEKYAQAENTIDQLRFQPKLIGDSTPPSNASEGIVHFIQQPKVNMATVRSSGAYHASSTTPLSSLRQVPSTTTTTTTTSALKSVSPANSCTVESVFFDEVIPQKIIVQELTTPETLKLDLLIQTKTLSEKMRSFLTLMDANQLSFAEQQQVYESIKDDYEKLLKTLERQKRGGDLSDVDLDGDLNQELETMKQLLKEIVKRITDNLLGKSINSSETGRQSRLTHEETQSSQSSARSSLCNHADLMEQYQKLLNAVNTETLERKPTVKSPRGGVEKTISRHSSQSDDSAQLPPTGKHQKPYIHTVENSDDEQRQNRRTTPSASMKRVESASFGLDYPPSTANKHHQHGNDDPRHGHRTKKKDMAPSQRQSDEYDNLENITKGKRKGKSQTKKHSDQHHEEKELTPSTVSIPANVARFSSSSIRTRTSDYDSGIGTNNTTKLSRDRLNTSTMDESHYQSLDEDKRHYSNERQGSMSSDSSRSSGSGATSPKNVHGKYTKRIGSSSSLRRYENARRKPSGHSDTYQSDVETHLTGSFDPIPQSYSSSCVKRSRRNHHSLQPQRSVSHRSHTIHHPHRSYSVEDLDYSSRPQTAPEISSRLTRYHPMGRKYQSGFIYRSSNHPDTMYKSSFYIDQAHTNRRLPEKPIEPKPRTTSKNLYLDPQTGIIYRYVPNANQPPPTIPRYQPTTQVKTATDLYQCGECGSITTYHHRHHIERVNKEIDDPGYESGNKKVHRYRRYVERVASSDSDPDETSTELDLSLLNEAYERAKKAQHRSQNLSKHISRQLRLVLSTM